MSKHAESARRLKPPLSYLCPPARFYDSKFSVVTIRIGGCIALLIAALMVFVLIYSETNVKADLPF